MPPPIVAGRFLANGAAWIDLATGCAVRLRATPAGDRRAQLHWSDLCAAYAPLRHPLLNPLVDYGALDAAWVFEAYAAHSPVPTNAAGAQRLLTHAVQFLRARGVDLAPGQAALAWRPRTAGPPLRGRPLGLVLQPRDAFAAIDEVLDAVSPGGAQLIFVHGEPSSGLRTARDQIARAARLRGYVPVAPAVLAGRWWLIDALVERHVCVLVGATAEPPDARALSALLVALGRESARRHVVVSFSRERLAGAAVVPLRPMGVRAMTSMVFVDGRGLSAGELFDAARGAAGRPGLFLDRLGAHALAPDSTRALVAHETPEPYGVPPGRSEPEGQTVGARVSRMADVLTRAASRANALAARGRHAAATRILLRASRVLAARGEANEAARCAARLGQLHLARGDAAGAASAFDRARTMAGDTAIVREAALGLATAWIEDGRLGEAEALLRSIVVAAGLEQRQDGDAVHALARSLYWQGRYGEAAAFVGSPDAGTDARRLAIAARLELADGSVAGGLQLARRAAQTLDATAANSVVAEIERVVAAALVAAGDFVAARGHALRALHAARRGRRPLDVVRARMLLLDIAAQADSGAAAVRRLGDRLRALATRASLPRLVRFQLHHAIAQAFGTGVDPSTRALEQLGARWPRPRTLSGGRAPGLSELEAMLEVCHLAKDDREALDRLCVTMLERLRAAAVAIVASAGRLAGHAGKPWDGRSPAVDRALAAAAGVSPADCEGASRFEAAEPVKFGGEIIGAVACRWIAGTPVCAERAIGTLKAAALAAAAPLRAVVDRAMPVPGDPAWADLIGESAEAAALREAVVRAARAPYPVLIEGESGSGKELVARAVHRLGPRRDRRFCAVNCAALGDELLEAELFGHARGAFTGAVAERAGLFEEADGGTLLLDEIGELSPRAQAKLLRAIQEGEIRRVGENFSRNVDVRIVAATNRSLAQEAAAGRFRTDLRFRLDVIRIAVPPLRDRAADIPLLAAHFWNEAARRVGSHATLSSEALAALSRYDWPGNVRELQNAIAWLAVHSPRRGRIGAAALPAGIAGSLPASPLTFERAREEFERRFIRSALARANGHRASAAASLGITRQGLAKMMRRLQIDDRPSA